MILIEMVVPKTEGREKREVPVSELFPKSRSTSGFGPRKLVKFVPNEKILKGKSFALCRKKRVAEFDHLYAYFGSG